jgi:hypothetical protein
MIQIPEQDKKIIANIQRKLSDNELGIVWITQGLEIATKEAVRQAKRFYHSAFRDMTSEDKVFWPLVKSSVDSIVANVDFDLKDISVVPNYDGYHATGLLMSELLRKELKRKQFGKLMNEAEVSYVRDGTVVVRTWEEGGEPMSMCVDLENFFTDFNTSRPNWFLERVTVPKDAIPDTWNKEAFTNDGATVFPSLGIQNPDNVVAYRFEGLMPRGWINGAASDKSPVWGMMWVTGVEQNSPYIHVRKILGKSREDSSYTFAQYTPNDARFIGMGVPEALRHLQQYANLLINNRVRRGSLASQGMLTVKRGAGISPDMVDRMRHGLAIPVNNVGDISQLPVQDVSNASFNEESSILSQANQLTGATEVSRGAIEKSGVTLGEAQLAAGFSSKRFEFHREQLGFMFQRIVQKWYDIIMKNMNEQEVVRVADENIRTELSRELGTLDRAATVQSALQTVGPQGAMMAAQQFPPEYFAQQRFKANEFRLLKDRVMQAECLVDITVNDEEVDKSQLAGNLVQVLPMVQGQEQQAIISRLFDILGIGNYKMTQ